MNGALFTCNHILGLIFHESKLIRLSDFDQDKETIHHFIKYGLDEIFPYCPKCGELLIKDHDDDV